jgi:hypothetical protein
MLNELDKRLEYLDAGRAHLSLQSEVQKPLLVQLASAKQKLLEWWNIEQNE